MTGLYIGPIIDAHIHLWDLGIDRHPWLRLTEGAVQPLGDLTPIRQTYLIEDYLRDAANQDVVAAVQDEEDLAGTISFIVLVILILMVFK